MHGTKESIGFVFTASSYDQANEVHHLVAIYGNCDDAKKAVGKNEEVLMKEIRKN